MASQLENVPARPGELFPKTYIPGCETLFLYFIGCSANLLNSMPPIAPNIQIPYSMTTFSWLVLTPPLAFCAVTVIKFSPFGSGGVK